MDTVVALFTANPLAQSVGLIAFLLGILTFLQRDDQRLRVFLAVFSVVIGVHFFLLGGVAAAYAAWLSGLRSYVSSHTRHVAVMIIFLLIVWVLGIPSMTHPIQWLAIMGTTLGTWALYREQGVRLRLMLLTGTLCWMVHNYAIGSIGGAMIETCFLFVNSYTIYRLRRDRT
jgi:hypothetical protein